MVPVNRIPKTTSGKIQRHLLEEQYAEGEFTAALAELAQLRATRSAAAGVAIGGEGLESQLLRICNSVLVGRTITREDNLFEIGASSLKLIEIHEQIDRDYPGTLDITELFDHPTVAELATHLASKLN